MDLILSFLFSTQVVKLTWLDFVDIYFKRILETTLMEGRINLNVRLIKFHDTIAVL